MKEWCCLLSDRTALDPRAGWYKAWHLAHESRLHHCWGDRPGASYLTSQSLAPHQFLGDTTYFIQESWGQTKIVPTKHLAQCSADTPYMGPPHFVHAPYPTPPLLEGLGGSPLCFSTFLRRHSANAEDANNPIQSSEERSLNQRRWAHHFLEFLETHLRCIQNKTSRTVTCLGLPRVEA